MNYRKEEITAHLERGLERLKDTPETDRQVPVQGVRLAGYSSSRFGKPWFEDTAANDVNYEYRYQDEDAKRA